MSQSFKLYRLQQIDSNLDQSLSRINQIEQLIKDDRLLIEAVRKVQIQEKRMAEAQKELDKAETNVRDQQIKIEQTESSLYGGKIRNPKELQDLENELGALKRYRSVLEERLLDCMMIEEEIDAEHSAAVDNLEEIRAERGKDHKQLESEKAQLEKDVARLEEERQVVARSIPDPDLSSYQNLRQKKKGIAVAKVNDKFCSACGSTLSTSLLYEARSPNNISYCETCGRILYAG